LVGDKVALLVLPMTLPQLAAATRTKPPPNDDPDDNIPF